MYVLPLVVVYFIFAYFVFKQLFYIRKFKNLGITHGGNSKTLKSLGMRNSFEFKNMQKRGIFVEVKDNKVYLEIEKGNEFAKKRRGLFYTVTFLFVVIFFFILNNYYPQ